MGWFQYNYQLGWQELTVLLSPGPLCPFGLFNWVVFSLSSPTGILLSTTEGQKTSEIQKQTDIQTVWVRVGGYYSMRVLLRLSPSWRVTLEREPFRGHEGSLDSESVCSRLFSTVTCLAEQTVLLGPSSELCCHGECCFLWHYFWLPQWLGESYLRLLSRSREMVPLQSEGKRICCG